MKYDHFDARDSLEKIVDALTPEFKRNLSFDIEIVENYIKDTKELSDKDYIISEIEGAIDEAESVIYTLNNLIGELK